MIDYELQNFEENFCAALSQATGVEVRPFFVGSVDYPLRSYLEEIDAPVRDRAIAQHMSHHRNFGLYLQYLDPVQLNAFCFNAIKHNSCKFLDGDSAVERYDRLHCDFIALMSAATPKLAQAISKMIFDLSADRAFRGAA